MYSPSLSSARATAHQEDQLPKTANSEYASPPRQTSRSFPASPYTPSREQFFGTSRSPSKWTINRAYYNPILPPEEECTTLSLEPPNSRQFGSVSPSLAFEGLHPRAKTAPAVVQFSSGGVNTPGSVSPLQSSAVQTPSPVARSFTSSGGFPKEQAVADSLYQVTIASTPQVLTSSDVLKTCEDPKLPDSEQVLRAGRSKGGDSKQMSAGGRAPRTDDFNESQAELNTEPGVKDSQVLARGGSSEINNDFGVGVREIIKRGPDFRGEKNPPGETEIAGARDRLEVQEKRIVDVEILRAEHQRLQQESSEGRIAGVEADDPHSMKEIGDLDAEDEAALREAAPSEGRAQVEERMPTAVTAEPHGEGAGSVPSGQVATSLQDGSPHPSARPQNGAKRSDEKHDASVDSHLVYDFAYEARQKQMEAELSELEQMKERFAKLLLGEDMSGGNKGVSTALAISNAITNLSAAVFGELHKLEPLSAERKKKWKRELEWLLCPADHIVEMVAAVNQSADGAVHERMIMRQRADLHASLPALRKLDTMLTECLDSFAEKGFWYVDPGQDSSGEYLRGSTPHQSGRWWLPEAMVPSEGLDERSLRKLAGQKAVATQILKAAMAINAQVLSEMAVPDAYWETLAKSARSVLGEQRYRLLTGDSFSPDILLSTVHLSDEHTALTCANDLEAAIHIWRRKGAKKAEGQERDKFGHGFTPSTDSNNRLRNALLAPVLEKREKHAGHAMDALWNLRLRCPGLPQTTLHVFKIQFNKDVGQAILESYSRVLESLASNILNRIEHVQAVNEAMLERARGGELPQSGPPTPSSQHSSMGPPSGSQTPTSPLREAHVMYLGKPALSGSFTNRIRRSVSGR